MLARPGTPRAVRQVRSPGCPGRSPPTDAAAKSFPLATTRRQQRQAQRVQTSTPNAGSASWRKDRYAYALSRPPTGPVDGKVPCPIPYQCLEIETLIKRPIAE